MSWEIWEMHLSFRFVPYIVSTCNSPLVKSLIFKSTLHQTSLVVQWLGVCLALQGTVVPSLIQEDPTWHRATKPTGHNYWSPLILDLGSATREVTTMRSLHTEIREEPWLAATREKSECSSEDPAQPKLNLKKFFFKVQLYSPSLFPSGDFSLGTL